MKLRHTLEFYRDLRPKNIGSDKYKHLYLLIFWPLFGLAFLTVERILPAVWPTLTGHELVYREVVCSLDAAIPFCEWFVFPYYWWFVFLVGMGLYGLFYDIQAFSDFSWYIIVTYTACMIIYLVYPNMQALRPPVFERDNFMIRIVQGLYNFDTNTNVFPSIHVVGSFAACFAGLRAKRFAAFGWKVYFIVATVLICASTVLLKQHSILDVFGAIVLGAISYPIVFLWLSPRRERPQIIPEKEH